MGNQANVHSEAILLRKSQWSYSSAVEFQYNINDLAYLESVGSEYSTLVARKGWSIAGYPSESAHWSTKVIRQLGIQSLKTRRERLAASREKQQGYAAYKIGTGCHKQACYQVFQSNMIMQFSTDYSCSMISVQTVLLIRHTRFIS